MKSAEDQVDEARRSWESGRALDAGCVLVPLVPANRLPTWAASILRLVSERAPFEEPSVELVLETAADPDRWKDAHRVFSRVRFEVMAIEREERQVEPNRHRVVLVNYLLLAELVAKVTYNATDPDDEFDEDSAPWLVACLREFTRRLRDRAFSEEAWRTASNVGGPWT